MQHSMGGAPQSSGLQQQKQKVQPVPGKKIDNRASTQAPLSQQKEWACVEVSPWE